MSEQITPKDQSQNPNPAPRNPFTGTGIIVTGIIRTFETSQGNNGKLYHDLYLSTAANPDLKISLKNPPDPTKFILGTIIRIPVMLRSWKNKDGLSGTLLVEAAL